MCCCLRTFSRMLPFSHIQHILSVQLASLSTTKLPVGVPTTGCRSKVDTDFQIFLLVSKGTMQIYAVEGEDKQCHRFYNPWMNFQ